MRTVFTTGQVAKMAKVAPRTVSKWFDSGRLRGYRIPGSNERRIPRENLLQFFREHGMPMAIQLESEGKHTLVTVGLDKSTRQQLDERAHDYMLFYHVDDMMDLGCKLGELFSPPDVILLDGSMGEDHLKNSTALLRGKSSAAKADILLLAGLNQTLHEIDGDYRVFRHPFKVDELLGYIDSQYHKDSVKA